MADLPPYRTPRWVKVFGIIAIGVVLLVVVGLLVATALGLHDPSVGPRRHGPGSDTNSPGAPSPGWTMRATEPRLMGHPSSPSPLTRWRSIQIACG